MDAKFLPHRIFNQLDASHFSGAPFISDTEWLIESFEEGYREQKILIVDDDVLRPEVLQKVIFRRNATQTLNLT